MWRIVGALTVALVVGVSLPAAAEEPAGADEAKACCAVAKADADEAKACCAVEKAGGEGAAKADATPCEHEPRANACADKPCCVGKKACRTECVLHRQPSETRPNKSFMGPHTEKFPKRAERPKFYKRAHPHPAVVAVYSVEPERFEPGDKAVWVNTNGSTYHREGSRLAHTNKVRLPLRKAKEYGYRPSGLSPRPPK